MSNLRKTYLWEILIPTIKNNGKPNTTRFHKVWDAKVSDITGGLTILTPTKGQWLSQDKELYQERMIPVRIACDKYQIEIISDMTAKYYGQKSVMYYMVSDYVVIKEY